MHWLLVTLIILIPGETVHASETDREIALKTLGFSSYFKPSDEEIKFHFRQKMIAIRTTGEDPDLILDAYGLLSHTPQAASDAVFPRSVAGVSISYFEDLQRSYLNYRSGGVSERSVFEMVALSLDQTKPPPELSPEVIEKTKKVFFGTHWTTLCFSENSFRYASEHGAAYVNFLDGLEYLPDYKLRFKSRVELEKYHRTSSLLVAMMKIEAKQQVTHPSRAQINLSRLLNAQEPKITSEAFFSTLKKDARAWESYSEFTQWSLKDQILTTIDEQWFGGLDKSSSYTDNLVRDLVAFRKSISDDPAKVKKLDQLLKDLFLGESPPQRRFQEVIREGRIPVATKIIDAFKYDPELRTLSTVLPIHHRIANEVGYCFRSTMNSLLRKK